MNISGEGWQEDRPDRAGAAQQGPYLVTDHRPPVVKFYSSRRDKDGGKKLQYEMGCSERRGAKGAQTMAIVRCHACGLDQSRTRRVYHRVPVLPIGYPATGIICGIKDCRNPGQVWLEQSEYRAYQKGERFFGVNTNAVKVRVI